MPSSSPKEEYYKLIVKKDEIITAKFNEVKNYKISTIIIPENSGEVITEDDTYPSGAIWGNTAYAEKGYEFAGWKSDDIKIDDPKNDDISFKIPKHDVTIKAVFKKTGN